MSFLGFVGSEPAKYSAIFEGVATEDFMENDPPENTLGGALGSAV